MPVCVDDELVGQVISGWTGIPVGKMMRDEAATALELEKHLGERIIGQDHVLEVVSHRIRTSYAKIEDPNKPKGVFLFVGPSGVGKTEMALTLSDLLYGGERNMVTINMSEFQEAHTVSTLKGSPPGYVGYGEGGVLTEAVRRRPYSVVLLDEIEKAHPDVLELFFQVFDKGRMEDAEGREIDFKNTIIILTTQRRHRHHHDPVRRSRDHAHLGGSGEGTQAGVGRDLQTGLPGKDRDHPLLPAPGRAAEEHRPAEAEQDPEAAGRDPGHRPHLRRRRGGRDRPAVYRSGERRQEHRQHPHQHGSPGPLPGPPGGHDWAEKSRRRVSISVGERRAVRVYPGYEPQPVGPPRRSAGAETDRRGTRALRRIGLEKGRTVPWPSIRRRTGSSASRPRRSARTCSCWRASPVRSMSRNRSSSRSRCSPRRPTSIRLESCREPLILSMRLPDGSDRQIHGICNRFAQHGKDEDLTSYEAEIVPWLWFLSLNQDCKIFQEKTVLEIIEEVFGKYEQADFEFKCVGELRAAGILRPVQGVGSEFRVPAHGRGGDLLLLRALGGGPQADPGRRPKCRGGLCTGQDIFRVDTTPDARDDEDVITALEREHQVYTNKVTLTDYDPLQPSMNLESSASDDDYEELYDYPGNYTELSAGERYASLLSGGAGRRPGDRSGDRDDAGPSGAGMNSTCPSTTGPTPTRPTSCRASGIRGTGADTGPRTARPSTPTSSSASRPPSLSGLPTGRPEARGSGSPDRGGRWAHPARRSTPTRTAR